MIRLPPTVVLLVLLPLVSWVWIVVMARDMYGPMTGASAWMMTPQWDVSHLLLLWAMWAVMMTGMMLPSASPMLLVYGVMARRGEQRSAAPDLYARLRLSVVWTAFSLGATALQRVLAAFLLVSPMMEITNPKASAAVVAYGGCLSVNAAQVRLPADVSIPGWIPDETVAHRIVGCIPYGSRSGANCVGCCWALMLLLFAGGVMNLTVIATLTAFVAFEKLAPFDMHGARISGVLLTMVGIGMIVC